MTTGHDISMVQTQRQSTGGSREEFFFFAQITCVAGGILNLTNEFFSR
jgi:hypothetical protein